MERKKYRIVLLITILLSISLGGCGWQFAAFEYTSEITARPSPLMLESPDKVVLDADGEIVPREYTTAIGTAMTLTGNPVADVFVELMKHSGAIDAAKTISVCVVGDPAATAAFRIDNRLFKTVKVRKGVFVIKTKDSK